MNEEKKIEVTYTFYLPEHKDDLWMVQNSYKMWSLLHDLDNKCRGILKWEENPKEGRAELAEEIRNMIHNEVNIHEVS